MQQDKEKKQKEEMLHNHRHVYRKKEATFMKVTTQTVSATVNIVGEA